MISSCIFWHGYPFNLSFLLAGVSKSWKTATLLQGMRFGSPLHFAAKGINAACRVFLAVSLVTAKYIW
jgi:hypothetical protein